MTTYNGEKFVAEQLRSIAAQSRPPNEVVICDDRSTDRTLAVVESVLAEVPFKVEVITNPAQLGVVANVEQAIRRTTGDIIVLADQDDIWSSVKLARLAERFEAAPEAGAIFSNATIIDRNSRETGERLWSKVGMSGRRTSQWRTDPVGVLMHGNIVTGAALAFRASMKHLILPIPRQGWHDLWIAYLIAATSRIDAIDEPLLGYRVHSDNAAGLPRSIRAELERRLKRPEERYENLAQIRALVARLEVCSVETEPTVSRLQAKIRHLEFRFDLPTSFTARTFAVLQAAMGGRYRMYSAGTNSALFDIAYGGRLARSHP